MDAQVERLPQKGTELKEGFEEIFGAKIHYLRKGSGPTQILLDGWGGSTAAFNRVLPYLSREHDCIAVDDAGFGVSSEFPNKRHTIANYAECVVELMDRLGVNKAGLIGDSMGGLTALQLAAKYPERFSYVIIQGTPNFSEKVRNLIGKTSDKIPAKMFSDVQKAPAVFGVFAWLNPEFRFNILKERRERVARMISSSPRAVVESFKDMVAFDLGTVASQAKTPTLIVEGDIVSKSPISTVNVLKSKISGAQVRLIPKASHTVISQRPKEFAEVVLDFAQKIEGENTQMEGAVG